jgi:hypothetical protein
MSAEARPISDAQFRQAIEDLPLENLYTKAAEIENSITHLRYSNKQLQEYSDSIKNDATLDGETKEEVGDRECLEAINENDVVIRRQEERVALLREEVERRGGRWHGGGEGEGEGESRGEQRNGGGRLTDEELRRQLAERMGEDEEDGMHL